MLDSDALYFRARLLLAEPCEVGIERGVSYDRHTCRRRTTYVRVTVAGVPGQPRMVVFAGHDEDEVLAQIIAWRAKQICQVPARPAAAAAVGGRDGNPDPLGIAQTPDLN